MSVEQPTRTEHLMILKNVGDIAHTAEQPQTWVMAYYTDGSLAHVEEVAFNESPADRLAFWQDHAADHGWVDVFLVRIQHTVTLLRLEGPR